MPEEKEKEYEELKKLAEKAGIVDLMKIYGEYKELLQMSYRYLQELGQKYTFSTVDSSA